MDDLPQCGWPSPSPLRAGMEQNGRGRFAFISLFKLGHSSSSVLMLLVLRPLDPQLEAAPSALSASQAFGLCHWLCWACGWLIR